MTKKLKTRNEVDIKDKWSINDIYENNDLWLNDYNDLKIKQEEITKFKNHIMDNANTLYELIKLDNEIEKKLSKLVLYAYMKSDEDTSNATYQELKGKIDSLSTKISENVSYIIPELLKSDYTLVLKYINELELLKEYELYLERIYRVKNHTLTEHEEKIISSFSNIIETSKTTYLTLKNSDLKYGILIDEEGNEIELTDSNYMKYIRSSNREVRKNAFITLYKTFNQFKNTISKTLLGEVNGNNTIAKIRGFNNAKESALFKNDIPVSVYDNLIKVVNDNLNTIYKYLDLKKEVLKLDELHLYDSYVSIVEKSDKNYTYEEAKNLVLNALSVLGEDYVKNLNIAFDNNWIDKYPNKFKRGGAYAWATYETHPYVLLNYDGLLTDISTLAHELGHAMHYKYSIENNPYQYHDHQIFVAEVASTVNEMLLYKYMLNNTNDKTEKLVILNEIMDLFKGTIYRQTMFAEFEDIIHSYEETNGTLTDEYLCNTYYELNKKYFGSNVVVDDEIRYEWERIPHFYMDFYVYQYATGLSAACHIVTSILEKKEGALEKYLEFLKSGNNDYPINLLEKAGVDMNNEEVIKNALNLFDQTIEEFKELYNS